MTNLVVTQFCHRIFVTNKKRRGPPAPSFVVIVVTCCPHAGNSSSPPLAVTPASLFLSSLFSHSPSPTIFLPPLLSPPNYFVCCCHLLPIAADRHRCLCLGPPLFISSVSWFIPFNFRYFLWNVKVSGINLIVIFFCQYINCVRIFIARLFS